MNTAFPDPRFAELTMGRIALLPYAFVYLYYPLTPAALVSRQKLGSRVVERVGKRKSEQNKWKRELVTGSPLLIINNQLRLVQE